VTSRILLVSAHFPPSTEVGGRRVVKLAEHLPKFGYEPLVLTLPVSASNQEIEIGLEAMRDNVLRVAPWPNPVTSLSAATRRLIRKISNKRTVLSVAKSKLKRQWSLSQLALVPDRHVFWYPAAKRAAFAVGRKCKIQAVLTSAPPWTCHLVGSAVQKELRVPWVADFRDPWLPANRDRPLWRWWIERHLEADCLRDADLVICNTNRIRQLLLNKVCNSDSDRFIVVPNGFEPVREAVPTEQRDHRLLLHLGTIYGTRRIDTFCIALKMLLESGRLHAQDIRVLFVGEVEECLLWPARLAASRLFEEGIIQILDPISWREADEYVFNADVHLIFQGDFCDQIPMKFFECLKTGKPVLAVARDGELTRIISETNSGMYAPPDNPVAVAEALLKAISTRARSFAEVESGPGGRYLWDSLVGKLAWHVTETIRHYNDSKVKNE
jgi:glycosyltransferase involved in cell wall biosynthesis